MQFKDIPVGERFNFANAVAGITDSGRLTKSGVNQATDPHGLPVLMDDNTIESAVKNVGTVFDSGREVRLFDDMSLMWSQIDGPIYEDVTLIDLINSGLANSESVSKLLVIICDDIDSEWVGLGRPIKRIDENTLEAFLDKQFPAQPSTIKIVGGEPFLLAERPSGDAVHELKKLSLYSELLVSYFLKNESDYAGSRTLKEHELGYIKSDSVARGRLMPIKKEDVVTNLQKQLAETEKEFDKFKGKNKGTEFEWEGPGWQLVDTKCAEIRSQLFDLTGDYYGRPKIKPAKPASELLEADYDAPWDVPKEVLAWLRKNASLLTSDATDAVRWSRIIDTVNDERYPSGELTIYRAVEQGDDIRPGDWVTTERIYAEEHLSRYLGGKGRILEEAVEGADVLVSPTGNADEAIYAPAHYSISIDDWDDEPGFWGSEPSFS